jgi:cytochrome c556
MRKRAIVAVAVGLTMCAVTVGSANEASEKLPAGPIRDRHELMEGIGKNAKVIGDAVKAGTFEPVAAAAAKIQASAAQIDGLFPPGSTHPQSRAKPEIWTDWAKFQATTKQLAADAGALATVAQSGGDVPAAAKTLFGACKSCHDQFRVPEKDKKD